MHIKEEIFHYLWKTKRLPFHKFSLTDGRKLEVIDVGTHNVESGPDFSNAKIKIDDLIWSGNIEIHVNVNGYAAYMEVDQEYLITRLKSFLPSVVIHKTSVEQFSFLKGLNAHYHVMSEENYNKGLLELQ